MLIAFFPLTDFAARCWTTMCELSPWLLLGMLISGILHVALPGNFVKRRFRGFGGVVQSVLLGVPLPLCSCGVIPAGIGLKNDGASDGAAVGFLISTPQTGVDSVLVSASFFGWPFAIFKMLAAAITGIAGGWLTEVAAEQNAEPDQASPDSPTIPRKPVGWLAELMSHAMEILQSIWLWLLVGVFVSALIGTCGFESFFQRIEGYGLLAGMLLMLAIAVPMYVCATASVPIAAALVSSGLPPALALVFLMAGPATNLTTMGAVRERFGWKVLAIYLGTLISGSFLAAFLFDGVLGATTPASDLHQHHHQGGWSILSAVIVLLLIGHIIGKRFWVAKRPADGLSIDLFVAGMNCGSCVNRIESAIGKLANVDSIRVDLGRGVASIHGTAPVEQLVSAIESLGFEVKSPAGDKNG